MWTLAVFFIQRRGDFPLGHVIDDRADKIGKQPGNYQRQYNRSRIFQHDTNGHHRQYAQENQGNLTSIDIHHCLNIAW